MVTAEAIRRRTWFSDIVFNPVLDFTGHTANNNRRKKPAAGAATYGVFFS